MGLWQWWYFEIDGYKVKWGNSQLALPYAYGYLSWADGPFTEIRGEWQFTGHIFSTTTLLLVLATVCSWPLTHWYLCSVMWFVWCDWIRQIWAYKQKESQPCFLISAGFVTLRMAIINPPPPINVFLRGASSWQSVHAYNSRCLCFRPLHMAIKWLTLQQIISIYLYHKPGSLLCWLNSQILMRRINKNHNCNITVVAIAFIYAL